jgi:hypothetical protein
VGVREKQNKQNKKKKKRARETLFGLEQTVKCRPFPLGQEEEKPSFRRHWERSKITRCCSNGFRGDFQEKQTGVRVSLNLRETFHVHITNRLASPFFPSEHSELQLILNLAKQRVLASSPLTQQRKAQQR